MGERSRKKAVEVGEYWNRNLLDLAWDMKLAFAHSWPHQPFQPYNLLFFFQEQIKTNMNHCFEANTFSTVIIYFIVMFICIYKCSRYSQGQHMSIMSYDLFILKSEDDHSERERHTWMFFPLGAFTEGRIEWGRLAGRLVLTYQPFPGPCWCGDTLPHGISPIHTLRATSKACFFIRSLTWGLRVEYRLSYHLTLFHLDSPGHALFK